MLNLFHAPTTRSFRILWLLNELGIDHTTTVLDFYSHERHGADYRRVNPMGSVPAMTDGQVVLTESGAIINYLLQNYGEGRFSAAEGTASRAAIDEWMFWSEGLFAVHQRIYWDHCAPPPGCIIHPIPSVGQEAKRQAMRYVEMLEGQLRDTGWVVGENLTGADFMLSFPLFLANLEGWFEELPKTKAYVGRMMDRPAFQNAIADTLTALQQMATTKPTYPSFRSTES
jgi:glutathione S-transferase